MATLSESQYGNLDALATQRTRQMKRGDHIFANGLAQTIDELATKALTELGATREGRLLAETFKSCRKILDRDPYHLTVDKETVSPFGDAHSAAFGLHTQRFRHEMVSYIVALRRRNELPPTPQNVQFFHYAILDSIRLINLHVEDWVRLACDPEAERLMPEKRKEIARGKAGLQEMKALILDLIHRL
jgi:hypothetical protein